MQGMQRVPNKLESRPPTWYEILGVAPGATHEEIRQTIAAEQALLDDARLRRLDATTIVRRQARQRRAQLAAVAAVLTNPAARARYDQLIGSRSPASPVPVPVPVPTSSSAPADDGLESEIDCTCIHRQPVRGCRRCTPTAPDPHPRENHADAAAHAGLVPTRYIGSCPSCDAPIQAGELIGQIQALAGAGQFWVCRACYELEGRYLRR